MKDFLFVLWNEFLSQFVPEKVEYEVKGECLKCGKCCNHMYSKDTYTEKEFKFMQFLYPSYRRFYIKGKDEEGNLIFACKLITPEGLCSDYKRRPSVCRRYPASKLGYNGKFHEGCGFKTQVKTFEDYLGKSE